MVAKQCFSSLLRIWTMLRVVMVSSSLNTYVPAGRICAPEPGISTGDANVTMVVRSYNCAEAVPGNIVASTAIPDVSTSARLRWFENVRMDINNS